METIYKNVCNKNGVLDPRALQKPFPEGNEIIDAVQTK